MSVILERPGHALTPPRARPARRRRLLPPGWPLRVLLFGYVVTWLLGFGEFIIPIVAVPMAITLLRRRIRVPYGFGLWLLFLLWMLASGIMTTQNAPGFVPGNASGHLASWALRVVQYLSATVILLYVGNVTEHELPTRTILRGLAFMFLVTIAGGYLALLFPRLQIPTPLGLVLPHSITARFPGAFHPSVSEVQGILGYPVARPSAPFPFANSWGSNLGLCLPFFVAAWLTRASSPRRRLVGCVAFAAALIPIIYSLNRGLWLGIGVAVMWLAVRLAARGQIRLLAAVGATLVVLAGLLVLSGLHQVISDRLAHGHSDQRRTELATNAFSGATKSPVIGWGTTRDTIGSNRSIAVGESAQCPNCGTPPTGTHGQLYLVVFSHGFVGAGLYVAFFLSSLWHYRHDWTDVGIAGQTMLLMFLLFTLYYLLLPSPQAFTMVGLGLLWRSARRRDLTTRVVPQWSTV